VAFAKKFNDQVIKFGVNNRELNYHFSYLKDGNQYQLIVSLCVGWFVMF